MSSVVLALVCILERHGQNSNNKVKLTYAAFLTEMTHMQLDETHSKHKYEKIYATELDQREYKERSFSGPVSIEA